MMHAASDSIRELQQTLAVYNPSMSGTH